MAQQQSLSVFYLCCSWLSLLVLVLVVVLPPPTQSFSVQRKHLAGIWKLQLQNSVPAAFRDSKIEGDILIKIQDDGSFHQCNDDDRNIGQPLSGCWDFDDDDGELKLAVDRHCSKQDVLLSGLISCAPKDDNNKLCMPNGMLEAGKFMYPPSHAAFFGENCMAAVESAGKFQLQQVMGFQSLISMPTLGENEDAGDETNAAEPQFTVSDFFGRKFFMTIEPLEGKLFEANQQASDIRTMPIQFFTNSTFEAIGINKILRGRFEIAENSDDHNQKNKLWFRVSRFGMGRSTPGSVYSEGIGLSHEDERTYVGIIEEEKIDDEKDGSKTVLRVQGKVTFGNDLGSDAR